MVFAERGDGLGIFAPLWGHKGGERQIVLQQVAAGLAATGEQLRFKAIVPADIQITPV